MATCTTTTFGSSTSPQFKMEVTIYAQTETEVTFKWDLYYLTSGTAASVSSSREYRASIDGVQITSGNFAINGITEASTKVAGGTHKVSKTTSSRKVSFSCSMDFNLTWSGTYAGTKTASSSIQIDGITTYTITYDANGGLGAPTSQTKTYGVDLVLSLTKPSRVGCKFVHWDSRSKVEPSYPDYGFTPENVYSPGDTYTKNNSATLYAYWEYLTYTVSYNANEGTGAPESQTKRYGTDLTLTTSKPKREGYSFMGWATSPSASEVQYHSGDAYQANADVTLYAVWKASIPSEPNAYNIKLYRSTSTGTRFDTGTYGHLEFDYATDIKPTTISIDYSYRNSASSSSYTHGFTTIHNASEYTGHFSHNSPNVTASYDWLVRISIPYSSGTITFDAGRIPRTDFYLIDAYSDGTGLAIGKEATRSSYFDVALPSIFSDSIAMEGDQNRISGSTIVSGDIDFADSTNKVYFNRSVDMNKPVTFNNNVSFDYNVFMNSDLTVYGDSTFNATAVFNRYTIIPSMTIYTVGSNQKLSSSDESVTMSTSSTNVTGSTAPFYLSDSSIVCRYSGYVRIKALLRVEALTNGQNMAISIYKRTSSSPARMVSHSTAINSSVYGIVTNSIPEITLYVSSGTYIQIKARTTGGGGRVTNGFVTVSY